MYSSESQNSSYHYYNYCRICGWYSTRRSLHNFCGTLKCISRRSSLTAEYVPGYRCFYFKISFLVRKIHVALVYIIQTYKRGVKRLHSVVLYYSWCAVVVRHRLVNYFFSLFSLYTIIIYSTHPPPPPPFFRGPFESSERLICPVWIYEKARCLIFCEHVKKPFTKLVVPVTRNTLQSSVQNGTRRNIEPTELVALKNVFIKFLHYRPSGCTHNISPRGEVLSYELLQRNHPRVRHARSANYRLTTLISITFCSLKLKRVSITVSYSHKFRVLFTFGNCLHYLRNVSHYVFTRSVTDVLLLTVHPLLRLYENGHHEPQFMKSTAFWQLTVENYF